MVMVWQFLNLPFNNCSPAHSLSCHLLFRFDLLPLHTHYIAFAYTPCKKKISNTSYAHKTQHTFLPIYICKTATLPLLLQQGSFLILLLWLLHSRPHTHYIAYAYTPCKHKIIFPIQAMHTKHNTHFFLYTYVKRPLCHYYSIKGVF